jgi:hypothetical protein
MKRMKLLVSMHNIVNNRHFHKPAEGGYAKEQFFISELFRGRMDLRQIWHVLMKLVNVLATVRGSCMKEALEECVPERLAWIDRPDNHTPCLY